MGQTIAVAAIILGALWLSSLVAWLPRASNPATASIGTRPSGLVQHEIKAARIRDVKVGERLAGRNPLLDPEGARAPDPDPATWRKLALRMTKSSGRLLHMQLLRPVSWIESAGAHAGATVPLDLPEMGAVGDALVLSVEACPAIESGPGNVVTGTFCHEADPDTKLLRVEFSNGAVIKGVTDNHLFWSEDRQNFVPVGELREGEQVRTRDGLTAVKSIESRVAAARTLLYNLEVHNEHVYQVTAAGILVHNRCILTPYAEDLGHHVFAKRAFEGLPNYDGQRALAIGRAELQRLGLRHLGEDSITSIQRRLFDELARSGRPNTLNLAEHARIARETLIEAGLSRRDADSVVKRALDQLVSWGINEPIKIPWN